MVLNGQLGGRIKLLFAFASGFFGRLLANYYGQRGCRLLLGGKFGDELVKLGHCLAVATHLKRVGTFTGERRVVAFWRWAAQRNLKHGVLLEASIRDR